VVYLLKKVNKGERMSSDWQKLTELTRDKDFTITSVKLKDENISLSGEFELPPLARLSYEDQVFVGEFIRSHGSIKHMEKAFGVSYPTIKNRLNSISGRLQLVEITSYSNKEEILAMLERGEISAGEALERLKK
jgi:hypothetical protein